MTWTKDGKAYRSACGRYRITNTGGNRCQWLLTDTTLKVSATFGRLKDAKGGMPPGRAALLVGERRERRRKLALETCITCRKLDSVFRLAEKQVGLTLADLRKHQEEAAFREALATAADLWPAHYGRKELFKVIRELT